MAAGAPSASIRSTTAARRERHGLVLGLAPGGAVRGMAYRDRRADWPATYAYLLEREQPTETYVEARAPARLADGRRSSALAFLSDRSHPQWAGALEPGGQAELIAGAARPLRPQRRLPRRPGGAPARRGRPRSGDGAAAGDGRGARSGGSESGDRAVEAASIRSRSVSHEFGRAPDQAAVAARNSKTIRPGRRRKPWAGQWTPELVAIGVHGRSQVAVERGDPRSCTPLAPRRGAGALGKNNDLAAFAGPAALASVGRSCAGPWRGLRGPRRCMPAFCAYQP